MRKANRKKHKSLKFNRKVLDQWDFIGGECENDLNRKYVPKDTTAATKWVLNTKTCGSRAGTNTLLVIMGDAFQMTA